MLFRNRKAEVVLIYNTGTWDTKAGVLLSCYGLYFMFRVSLAYRVRSFLKTIKKHCRNHRIWWMILISRNWIIDGTAFSNYVHYFRKISGYVKLFLENDNIKPFLRFIFISYVFVFCVVPLKFSQALVPRTSMFGWLWAAMWVVRTKPRPFQTSCYVHEQLVP